LILNIQDLTPLAWFDAYRLAIGYVSWDFGKAEDLSGNHRHARDQWLRASQWIPLKIAEGNGKTSEADRRRYSEIARGSALECAAMLSRLGRRGYSIKETMLDYESLVHDPDENKSQQMRQFLKLVERHSLKLEDHK
jgi:four helix bundle protein